jgi:hypothetical protein
MVQPAALGKLHDLAGPGDGRQQATQYALGEKAMNTMTLLRLVKILALCAAFLLGSALMARAQITFDASASGSGGGGTVSWSHTVGDGSDRILVVGLVIDVGDPFPPLISVTYGDQPLTQQVLNGGGNPLCQIWTLVAPQTGTAQVIVTFPLRDRIVGGSASFSGVDQATSIRATGQARAFSQTSLMVSTSVASKTGDVVIDAVALLGQTPSGTPEAEQTLRWSGNLNRDFGGGSTKPGDSGSTTMTWNLSVIANTTALGALAAISLIPAQATREEPIEALMETVQAFGLHHRIENALLAKLNAALAALADEDPEAARASLQAFIHQVKAQRGKKISAAQAAELIATAKEILAAIECPARSSRPGVPVKNVIRAGMALVSAPSTFALD